MLKLALSQLDEAVTGTITDGSTTAVIETSRARVTGDDATWQVGSWTVLLNPGSGTGTPPSGIGYGVITTAKTAKGTLVASLADGTKASGGLTLGKDNRTTFLQTLYGGHGFLAGEVSFADAPVLSGELHWSRQTPGDPRFPGFELPLALAGSRFLPRPAGTRLLDFADAPDNAAIVIAGLDPQPHPIVFSLTPSNVGFLFPNLHSLTFSIGKTGLFSGSFVRQTGGGGTPIRFGGAILQTQQIGGGYYLEASADGKVDLGPNP
jgi:hypothetical protein